MRTKTLLLYHWMRFRLNVKIASFFVRGFYYLMILCLLSTITGDWSWRRKKL